MKKRCVTFVLALLLAAASLSGCGLTAMKGTDLMTGVEPGDDLRDLIAEPAPDAMASVTDFSLNVLRQTMEPGQSALISPLSILSALGMTANGAAGETRTQMEEAFGLTVEELNDIFGGYSASLTEDSPISLANAIWFKETETFQPNEAFLQANAKLYGAGLYEAPMDDATCKEINAWVKKHTDGMIPSVFDRLPDDILMCLVNALAFDAEWPYPYEEFQVREEPFFTEDGQTRQAELMYSEEDYYLEDEKAVGLLKHYKGGEYAFAAILPNEGVTVEDYLASLTGQHLYDLLSHPQQVPVNAVLPKFEHEFSADLCQALQNMGMTDAFDLALADFTGIGESELGLSIDMIVHKTFISLGEKGTRAGAVTAVAMSDSADVMMEEPKEVRLDRPFIYLIIHRETCMPVFLGTVMDVGA